MEQIRIEFYIFAFIKLFMHMAEQTEQLNLFFELCDDGSVEEHRFSDCQNKIFLVGCYKMNSKNQLGWMMSPQDNGVDCRYNVRLDKGRDGWVNSSNPRVSKPDFVILYDIDSPYATPLTYRVLNSSVTTENQMREMAYPEPRGNYLVYKLKRVEIVGNLNIPEVIAFKNTNRQHIDGKPIYIYGKEMSNINHKQQTKTRHHSNDNLIFQDKDMPTIETVITNSKKDSIHLASHLTSLDLFSGCGGLTKGFEMAGIRSIFASDIDENCAKTFALNFPNTPFLCKDITLITKEEVDALTGGIVPDVIIGGPPCQGFSLANKRRNQVADDPRNKLFYGFVKFIDWYSPKAFVMENVKGLLSMQNGEVLKTIISAFANAGEFGYDVQYKVLLASDYGVPQNRERVILIGTRKDLGLTPTHPQPNTTNKITVTEAISDLPQIGAGEGCDVQKYPIEPQNEYQKLMRAHSCYVTNHIRQPYELPYCQLRFQNQ